MIVLLALAGLIWLLPRPQLHDVVVDDDRRLTLSADGRVVGSLVCEAGNWRLSWFSGADERLATYAGPVDGNVEVLAAALGFRLGRPVHLESLPT